MMNFTLSNQVQIPAVGIGTFMMTPDQAEQAVVDALSSDNTLKEPDASGSFLFGIV